MAQVPTSMSHKKKGSNLQGIYIENTSESNGSKQQKFTFLQVFMVLNFAQAIQKKNIWVHSELHHVCQFASVAN